MKAGKVYLKLASQFKILYFWPTPKMKTCWNISGIWNATKRRRQTNQHLRRHLKSL